jgi:uncharacterized surface protein with fasciclin (FAS1) repeats
MSHFIRTTVAALLCAAPLAACAMDGMEGGAASMASSSTIVETAAASPDFTTLVAAVQAAGLADTLSGPGPFTVFAPTNAAFDRLPEGTVATLVRPENKAMLQSILTYHVVAGRVGSADLVRMIKANGGSARLTTVQGGMLTARLMNGMVVLTDAKGGRSTVTSADMFQSNGVIHATDAVSMPG